MTIDPLIVDLYAGDFAGKPDIGKLVAAGPPWHGLILKATEGVYYPSGSKAALRGGSADWFLKHWELARTLAGARYGVDWFRGAYHYARIDQTAIGQADKFCQLIEAAGGWSSGDLWPMIDVESANNPSVPAAQIEDFVSRWAAKVKAATGKTPMLYGNQYLNAQGVRSTMGCGTLTVARYTPDLPPVIYQRIGWDLAKPAKMPTLWGWQYSGNPEGGALAGYPTKCQLSATENADIIAMIVAGGGQAAIDWTRANLNT